MLLPYNERADPDALAPSRRAAASLKMDRDNYWRRSEPTRLGKVFPDFATVSSPNFPLLPYRRDSPSRGMHNDILAIKQLHLHAFRSQMPFIHGAVNPCLRQKFNFDAGRSSILFQLSAVSQRLLSLN